jgi:hypothetical protein
MPRSKPNEIHEKKFDFIIIGGKIDEIKFQVKEHGFI